MKKYTINYFNEKTITFYGYLKECMSYAEKFSQNLVLGYNGAITISLGKKVVAKQNYLTLVDEIGEYAEAQEWEVK